MKWSLHKYKIVAILIIVLVFTFRIKILKAFGDFLIVNNQISFVEIAFVLSGGAFDRGNKAVELIKNNKAEKIVCTGANQPPDFKALQINMLESELTRKHIIAQIKDSTKVSLLKKGTSTIEESDAILAYCLSNDIHSILIISSAFHTKRIQNVFRKKFHKHNINIQIAGATSSSYNEALWWKSENGLIAVNNEYIKQVYYLLFK